MKSYKGVKIPKCNGRPQLWSRGADNHESLRIIMPDGRVDWDTTSGLDRWIKVKPDADIKNHKLFIEGLIRDHDYEHMYACTTGKTQFEAIKNAIRYDEGDTWFLGYL